MNSTHTKRHRSHTTRHLLLAASAVAAGTSQGAVVLTENVNFTLFPNGSADGVIDLNGNGSNDFHFNFGKNSNQGQQPFLDPIGVPQTGPATGNAVLAKGNTDVGTDRGLTVKLEGSLIDASAFQGHNARSGYFNANFNENGNIIGDWGGGGTVTGFVGLRTPSGNGTDFLYGWANFSYKSTPGSESLTLKSYAYESVPGVGITTIPEPNAIACFAMGAAGLASLRRRRAAC